MPSGYSERCASSLPYASELLRRGFLTCMAEMELHLYRLVVKLLEEGTGFLRNFSDETLSPCVPPLSATSTARRIF